MSTYWKSTPKKHCTICNVWFAADKVSVANHERGKKHQEAVQLRLKEGYVQKQKERKEQESLFAKIERDAAKAMARDEAAGGDGGAAAPSAAAPEHRRVWANASANYSQPGATAGAGDQQRAPGQGRGGGRGGHVQGAGRGQGRGRSHGTGANTTALVNDRRQTSQHEQQQPPPQPQPAAAPAPAVKWREAKTPEGKSYYYHVDTKETQWEKPAELQAQETAAAAAATAASSAAAASEDGTAAKDGAAAGTAESSAAQPEAEVAAAPVIGGWTRVEAAPVATEADAEKQARLKAASESAANPTEDDLEIRTYGGKTTLEEPSQQMTFEERAMPTLKRPIGDVDQPVAFKKKKAAGKMRQRRGNQP